MTQHTNKKKQKITWHSTRTQHCPAVRWPHTRQACRCRIVVGPAPPLPSPRHRLSYEGPERVQADCRKLRERLVGPYIYIHICICMYVCTYVCMNIYIHTHIHIYIYGWHRDVTAATSLGACRTFQFLLAVARPRYLARIVTSEYI